MSYLGDIALGQTLDFKFTSRAFATGAPTTLSGSPVISAYVGNGTTEITSGITLTVDFDSRTGLNNVRVVASGGNGFAAQTDVELVITTGTVGGTSVVGEVVGSFSIENRSAIRPTVAGRTLDVSSTGEAGVDWANVGSPTTSLNLSGTTISTSQAVASVSGAVGSVTGAVGSVTGAVGSVTGNVGGNVTGSVGSIASGGISEASYATTAGSFSPLGIVDQGTAQAAAAGTLTLRSAAAFGDNTLAGCVAAVFGSTQGYWQAVAIASNVGSSDVATLASNFVVTPTGTITYKIFAAPPADGTAAAIKVVTDRLNGMLELDGGSAGLYQFTPTALAEGGGSPSAIWNYDISAISTSGLAGTKLNSASSAGDPWGTSVPGAYGAGTAGFLLGTYLTGNAYTRLGAPVGASISADIAGVQSDTNDIQTRLPAALVSGRMDASLGAVASGVDFSNTMKTSIGTAVAASAVASVTGNVGGNVTGSVGSVVGAVGSVTGAVGSVTGFTPADVTAIKAKTDSLTFTTAGMVDSAVKRVGSTTLTLAGTGGQGYGG